jgi:hypothetical protein
MVSQGGEHATIFLATGHGHAGRGSSSAVVITVA